MPKYSGFDPIESHQVVTSGTTTGGTSYAGTVLTTLYLPFNDDVNDDSPFSQTITNRGSMTIDSTYTKFGSNALKSQSSGSLKIDNSTSTDFDGNGHFTIEFFLYVVNFEETKSIYTHNEYNNSYQGLIFFTGGGGRLFGYGSSNGSSWNIFSNKEFASSITTDTWHHVAMTYDGTTYRGYFNGTRAWEVNSSNKTGTGGDHYIFSRNNGGQYQPSTGSYYMDDFRITKGKALYTDSTYTVPTSALGLKQEDPVSLYLPFDSDVNDDSSHSHTVTSVASATISSTQSKFGGNSLSLNGTSQYLTIPDSDDFKFGSNDFTVEMWVYPTTLQQSGLYSQWGSGNNRSFKITMDPNGNISVNGSYNGTSGNHLNISSSEQLIVNNWYHIAAACVDGTVTLYINGIKNGSGELNGSYYNSTNDIAIGANIAGFSSNLFAGYIDDVRVINGVARYTKNFVPPSQAVGATLDGTNETNTTTDFTTLYLPFDSDIQDDSAKGHSMTATGDAAISSTQSKFGGYSLATDGTGDRLEFTYDTNSYFGNGDFTVEAWVWITGYSGGYYTVISLGQPGATGSYQPKFLLNVESSGSKVRSIVGGTYIDHSDAISGSFPTGEWVHLAATRHNGTYKTFINGVLNGSTSDSSNVASDSGTSTIGGANYGGGSGTAYSNNGYIDDLRVLKGYAKYTADFTPPSSAVGTSVSETVNDLTMLYMPFDATVSSTTVPSSQVEVYFPFEDDFDDDGPNSVTLTERGGGSSSGRDVYITSSYGVKPFGTNSAFFDNSSYVWNNTNSGNFTTTHTIDFGSNDWTIEFWAYVRPSQPNHGVLAQQYDSSGDVWFIQIDGSPSNGFRYGSNASGSITTSALTTNTWTHFAVERYGSTITFYINGSANVSGSVSGTISPSVPLGLGSYQGGAGGFNGLVKDFRIINGTAVYKGNFSVPTSAHGGNGATLGTTYQGGFEDLARNHSVTKNNDVTHNASVKKFGTSSAYFDGTSDYLSIPAGSFPFGDQDFTIEAWVYNTNSSTDKTLFDFRSGNDDGFEILLGGSPNKLRYRRVIDDSGNHSPNTLFTSSGALGINAWKHIAITRSNGTARMFVDGTLQNSASDTAPYGTRSGAPGLAIGAKSDGSQGFPGYIDDVRVIIGVAKYTENFTAPTSAVGTELSESSTSVTTDTKVLSSTWTMTNDGSSPRSFIDMRSDNTWANNEHLQSQPGHRWYGDAGGGGGSPSTTSVTMKVWGAGGGGAYWNGGSSGHGGAGGFSSGTMNITPGTTLNVVVGTKGLTAGPGRSTPTYPTYPTGPARPLSEGGGGTEVNGTVNHLGASGGGFSAVFDGPVSKPNAIIVAGGGGGGTAYDRSGDDESGGGGSGTPYGNPSVNPPTAAGGGYSGSPTDMQGGVGTQAITPRAAGGGGGGYRGGQGGFMSGSDGSEHGTGGGGGSGYVAPAMSSTTTVTGSNGTAGSSSGLQTNIHPTASSDPNYTSTYGKGGGYNSDGAGGYVVITSPSGTTTFTAPGTYTVP